jgi:hypothetical protein
VFYSLFLLLYAVMLTAISFAPSGTFSATANVSVESHPSDSNAGQTSADKAQAKGNRQTPTTQQQDVAFPATMIRIMGIICGVGTVICLTISGLTIYTGRCISQRRNKVLIYVMAAINMLLIPYGTLLGICAFVVLGSEGGKRAFGVTHDRAYPGERRIGDPAVAPAEL